MLLPTAVPGAAEAVTMPELDELTVVADKGPVRLLSDCISSSRLVAAVWSWFSAVVWFCRVVCCDSQACSGASAAVMEALTAAFTSMPGLDDPVAASRMELRSMAEAALDELSNESNPEIELIRFACSFSGAICYLANPG